MIDFFTQLDANYSIYRITYSGTWRLLTDLGRQDDETCNFIAWPGHLRLPEGLRVPQSYARQN